MRASISSRAPSVLFSIDTAVIAASVSRTGSLRPSCFSLGIVVCRGAIIAPCVRPGPRRTSRDATGQLPAGGVPSSSTFQPPGEAPPQRRPQVRPLPCRSARVASSAFTCRTSCASTASRLRPVLSVPCGLPSYVGPWPPVAAGREVIEPFADLAKSMPHSACACGGGAMYGRRPDAEPRSASRTTRSACATAARSSRSADRRFDRTPRRQPKLSLRDTYWPLLLLLPLALIMLLRGAPQIDERWEDHPAHFWIVLAAGVVCVALAIAISEAARRRRDARLLLIGLAFLVSAGLPRAARAGDAGRASSTAGTPASCSRRRSGSCSRARSRRPRRSSTGSRRRCGSCATRARCSALVLALIAAVGGRLGRRAAAARATPVTPDAGRGAARRVRRRSASSLYGYAAVAYFRVCGAARGPGWRSPSRSPSRCSPRR